MKLFVVLSLAVVALSSLADAASPGLSHVVRVGRNGRQVVHSKGVAGPGQGKRRVVRRKQNRPRQSRQFLSPVLSPALPALPPPPAPLTFSRPPPAQVSSAPAAFAAFNPFRVAPAVRVAPLAPVAPAVRLAPVAPVAPVAPAIRVAPLAPGAPAVRLAPFAPAVRFAPLAPPVRVAPLPLSPLPPQHVHVAHVAHSVPAPAPAVEVVEVREVPVQREYGAPVTVAPEVRNNYLAPAEEEPEVEVEVARNVETGYLSPAEDVEVEVEVAREAEAGYLAPHDSYLAVPETTEAPAAPEVEVVEARTSYIAAQPSDRAEQYVPRTKNARPEPIGIVRFSMNSPAEKKEFDYSFEAENGIKQEASGTMRLVDDSEVAVMRGSYEYIGADGLTYQVDWYADETGFHPTAPHLPQSVKPNHPEVAAAVRAQIEFAAQEDLALAASRSSNTYLAPEPLPSYNY